jgi:hypothetical protein
MRVSVPDNILDAVRAAAIKRHVSVEEFVSFALAAQSSSVLEDPSTISTLLSKVPDIDAEHDWDIK